MKKRVLRVRDGNLIPIGNNFAYVLGDHPNKTDDVDIGNMSVDNGELMQFTNNGVRVYSAQPILNGISPAQYVLGGGNPRLAFAAQEKYKDIHHLRDDGNKAKSGGIYIKPSKRGTFTAAAKRHGLGVQAFASKVLANKNNYSPAMVKKANFARNASKWHHKLGGEDWTTKYNDNYSISNDYAVITLQGNPLYDITGTTKYKSNNLDNPESRKFILDSLWAMENPYGQGLNRDGSYGPYGDPNGSDQDVGPGILLSNLPVKNSYTKQELEDYAYAKVLEGRDKIRQSFDEKYGSGEYDKLDDTRKYIMDDVRYRAGKLAQSKWSKFYQAVYDNDVEKLLTESRTEFKDSTNKVIGWDNGRVERLAQYFYPDIVVEHKGNKDTYLKVYKKK